MGPAEASGGSLVSRGGGGTESGVLWHGGGGGPGLA